MEFKTVDKAIRNLGVDINVLSSPELKDALERKIAKMEQLTN